MVFNFFLRLLVQKLEISKKTYRNRRKRTEIVENLPKTYQYRHVLPKNVPEIRKIVFFYFFLVVNYFAAPKSAKQRHRSFCSAIYSWKKRGKVTGVPERSWRASRSPPSLLPPSEKAAELPPPQSPHLTDYSTRPPKLQGKVLMLIFLHI